MSEYTDKPSPPDISLVLNLLKKHYDHFVLNGGQNYLQAEVSFSKTSSLPICTTENFFTQVAMGKKLRRIFERKRLAANEDEKDNARPPPKKSSNEQTRQPNFSPASTANLLGILRPFLIYLKFDVIPLITLEGDMVSYLSNVNKLVESFNIREFDSAAIELLMELTFPLRRIDVDQDGLKNGVHVFVEEKCPFLKTSSYVS